MAGNYYDDSGYSANAPEPTEAEASPAEEQAETSILPKSLFPSTPEVGETVTVKVVAVRGDEIEVSGVKAEPEEEEAEEPEEAEMPMTGGGMAAMME